MRVREVMTCGVECIAPKAPLQEAARKMRDLDAGCLPVCENDRLAGMLTDRDIVVRAVAEGRDARACTAGDIMTPEAVYCFEDDDIEEAARLMKEGRSAAAGAQPQQAARGHRVAWRSGGGHR